MPARKVDRMSATEPHGLAGLLPMLALVAGDEHAEDVQRGKIEHVRAAWPIALFGQIVALVIVIATMGFAASWSSVVPLLLPAVAGLALLATQTALLLAPPLARLAHHVQVRLAMALNAGLGAVQAILLNVVSLAPARIAHEAGLFALILSAAMIALALAPSPAILLAYGATLLIGCVVSSGSVAAAFTALAMTPVALTLLWRATSVDLRMRRQTLRRESQRGLAERLVREFESQGSGWFWETDREGRLTYLSRKVAAPPRPTGRPSIG